MSKQCCKQKVVAHQNGDHAPDELGPDIDCPRCVAFDCAACQCAPGGQCLGSDLDRQGPP